MTRSLVAGGGWIVACASVAFIVARWASSSPFAVTSSPATTESPTAMLLRVDLEDVSLETLARELTLQAGVQLMVDDDAFRSLGFEPATRVSLHSQGKTLEQALRSVTAQGLPRPLAVDLRSDESQGDLVPLAAVNRIEVEIRMFDLRPALAAMNKRAIPATTPSTYDTPLINLFTLLQETIEPDSWRENGGLIGSMRSIGLIGVVTQRPENLDLIQKILDDIAAERFTTIRNPRRVQ